MAESTTAMKMIIRPLPIILLISFSIICKLRCLGQPAPTLNFSRSYSDFGVRRAVSIFIELTKLQCEK